MLRKSAFTLSYAHEALRPSIRQAFPLLSDLPDAMRAALVEIAHREIGQRPLKERLEALKTLVDNETRDAQAAARFEA